MQATKTLFAGLDNAGKTTIIKFLQKKLTLNAESTPTKKANTSSQDFKLLGLQMSYWDLGGQEQYRLKYFNKEKNYFLEVSTFIYVIDADCIDVEGIAGQQNINPQSEFNFHYVIKINNKIYDPSYGSQSFGGPRQGEQEHENTSIAGIYTLKEIGGIT